MAYTQQKKKNCMQYLSYFLSKRLYPVQMYSTNVWASKYEKYFIISDGKFLHQKSLNTYIHVWGAIRIIRMNEKRNRYLIPTSRDKKNSVRK